MVLGVPILKHFRVEFFNCFCIYTISLLLLVFLYQDYNCVIQILSLYFSMTTKKKKTFNIISHQILHLKSTLAVFKS